MSIARFAFTSAVRPFSTKQKRANRKNMPTVKSYDTLFVFIPTATDK